MRKVCSYAGTTMSVNIIIYTSLQVYREDVNSFSFRRRLHSCQMSVCWIGEEGKKIMPLNYQLTLIGATDKYNFLIMTSDFLPLDIGTVIPVKLIFVHDGIIIIIISFVFVYSYHVAIIII